MGEGGGGVPGEIYGICQCQINKKEKTILKNKNYTGHGPPNKNPGITFVLLSVLLVFFFWGGGGGGAGKPITNFQCLIQIFSLTKLCQYIVIKQCFTFLFFKLDI